MKHKNIEIVVACMQFAIHALVINAISNDSKEYRSHLHKKREIMQVDNDRDNYLINTQGCSIPNYAKTMVYKEMEDQHVPCDKRFVFVTKVAENRIKFQIDYDAIGIEARRIRCCYKFAIRSNTPGKEDNSLKYLPCKRFRNYEVITLEEEIITVFCGKDEEPNNLTIIYNDAYLILKKKAIPFKEQQNKEKYNVLLLGMDTMSRGRIYHSVPKVVKYLKENSWLDYRGYNKVDLNTLPNMMTILTGIHPYYTSLICNRTIEQSKNMFIWNMFKQSGYVTAFGEESGSTFGYNAFKQQPTDHYARPFFTIESYKRGFVMCTKSKRTGLLLLNYAKQFVEAYKNNNFFGLFWLGFFSHDESDVPSASELMLLSFFEQLRNSGALMNTFIFFFSDHGVNYGHHKYSKESYYDSRLPMFFMWVPIKFRQLHINEYQNLQLNQRRLTTPFDFHATLRRILEMGDSRVISSPPAGCPKCKGLFSKLSSKRTCRDANIDEIWCSCHGLFNTDETHKDYKPSTNAALQIVNDIAKNTATTYCMKCTALKLGKIFRNDHYRRGNKTYFVVGICVNPTELLFEVIVRKTGKKFEPLYATAITPHRFTSNCVNDVLFRKGFCICRRKWGCKNKH